jgi:uncharacterized protein YbcI
LVRSKIPVTEAAKEAPMTEGHSDGARGESLARITSALVSLHKEFYGKGPLKAKTFLVNDTVICVLEGGFTIVERTLIESGEADAVHHIRRRFQSAMQTQFTSVVEDALGRQIRAYMSQVHTDPDISVELFMLEPTGDRTVPELAVTLEAQ